MSAILLSLLLIATACEAPTGSIEFRNETGDHLLWVATTQELLERKVAENPLWVTAAPGGKQLNAILGGSPPEWCDHPNVQQFLLRPIDGQPLNGRQASPANVTIDDFDIVAQLEPGICWGKSDPVWTYTGG